MRSESLRRRWHLAALFLAGVALAAMAMAKPSFAETIDLPSAIVDVAVDEASSAPRVSDLGDGFYAFSMPLSPELRERFSEAIDAQGEKAVVTSLTVIAVGQAPALPPTPVTTDHGALSDTTYPYTYWIITLNLGTQTVTKKTTWKLTGPGLRFNRSANVIYGANGIWGIGYRPGAGAGVPGIYTFQGIVSGGGAATTKSFAINP